MYERKARKIDYIVKNTPISFRKKFDALIDTNGTGDFVYSISRFLENPETKDVLTLSIIPGYHNKINIENFIEKYRQKFRYMNELLIENEVAPIFPNPDNVSESELIRRELVKIYPEYEINLYFGTESYASYERPIYKANK